MFWRGLFEKIIFSKHLKKILNFRGLFWESSSFIFRPRGKIIFSKNRDIIFTNNTRNLIFQRECFWKTIFSGRPEKENMVFRPWYEVPLKFLGHLGLVNSPIKLNAKLVFTLEKYLNRLFTMNSQKSAIPSDIDAKITFHSEPYIR